MFPTIAYLEWARRRHGKVRYDLATSGIPLADFGETELATGAPPIPSDGSAWALLRAAIATYNAVPVEETIAALGTTHALWLAYASLTNPGDEILVEEPAYEPLVAIAAGMGVSVRRFARPHGARFALDPERIASAITSTTRAVVVTNLHNPSGVRATDDELRAAAQVAERVRAFLVVDEVYAPFDGLVDPNGVFGRSARRLAPNIIAVSSLTKCFGLGPERVGWLVGPSDIVKRADDALIATAGMLPLSHARRGLQAFAAIQPLAKRARHVLAGKRGRVATWVGEQGYSWSAPAGGLFGFVWAPDCGDLSALLERAAEERGVLVTPGAFFGAPGGFRIAWSAPEEDLNAGLALLATALSPASANSLARPRRKE